MLKRWVNDLGTILLALALAVVVWIVAVQEENPIENQEFEEAVPISVRNQPAGTTFLPEGFEESVYLTIRAPRSSLDDLRVGTFSAWVDLKDYQVGEYQVSVQAECLDENVRIVELRPASVPVRLREEISRTVPVQVRLFGSPAVGYEFRDWHVEPAEVTVIGPASVVDKSAKATVNLDLRDRRESFSDERQVDIRDADNEIIGFVRTQPAKVQIVVPVVQKLDFTEVAVRAVTDGSVAPGYWVQGVIVEPSIITLSGDPSVLREIGGFVETLALDISGATGDIVERMPLDLPEQVSPVGVGVEGVKITVQIAAQQGNVNLLREPIVRGLSTNLEATVSPKEIAITLTGPLPRIRSLTDEDVFVYADLVDKDVGNHRIELTSLVPEGLQVISILPEAVEVEIRRIMPTPTPTWTPTPTPTPTIAPSGTVTITEGMTNTGGITEVLSTVTPVPPVSGVSQGTPTPPALTPIATPTKKPD